MNTHKRFLRPRPVHVSVRSRPGVVIQFPRKHVKHVPADGSDASANPDRGGSYGSGSAWLARNSGHTDSIADVSTENAQRHLFLCERYAACGACPAGDACPDVHAAPAKGKLFFPHHRDAADRECAVEGHARFDAAHGLLRVAPPNESEATLHVAASRCLATRALKVQAERGLCVCAHFVQKGVCDYGAACQFVHPLELPAMTPREAVVVAKPANVASLDSDANRAVDSAGGGGPVPPPAARHHDTRSSSVESAASLPMTPPRPALPSVAHLTCSAAGWTPSFGSSAPSRVFAKRYRHDPYTAHGWIVLRVAPFLLHTNDAAGASDALTPLLGLSTA